MSARSIWLVRHGETVGGSSVRYLGSSDVALAEIGREQMQRLAGRLTAQRFAALVHSPMARAVASARILAEALREQPPVVEVEAAFTEVHFGALEGLTEGEIEQRLPDWYRDWKAARVDRYPDGETFAGFAERVETGWQHCLERHPRGDLLLVAHKGVIKRVLAHALGLPWSEVRPWPLDLASLCVLEQARGRFTLLRFNEFGPT